MKNVNQISKSIKMRNVRKICLVFALTIAFVSCSDDDDNEPLHNNVRLEFNNTFDDTTIVLGDATSTSATTNISTAGQVHHFSELKYVVSNIRLVDTEGNEFPYHVNNLDKGATVVNQAISNSLNFVLNEVPTADYSQIKFGLGVKTELNTLDETAFPEFYSAAGANDTQMMWEWGTGYRFTKIEGFFGNDNSELSIHTGSTVEGEEPNYTQGVDAYREIVLNLPSNAEVNSTVPTVIIKADFDHLLSGSVHTITLEEGVNATNSVHSAANMVKFVDNLGGEPATSSNGMFSIQAVNN